MRDAPLNEADWIWKGCLHAGYTLAHFVPGHYSQFVQIRHPVLMPNIAAASYAWPSLPGLTREGEVRVPWTAVVPEGTASESAVLRAIEAVPQTVMAIAWLGACEVAVLAERLGLDTLFLYWDEVGSGRAHVDRCAQGSTEAWKQFANEHESDDHTWSPTYCWPTDRRWLLWTSYDLCYSVFACSDPAPVHRLCNDPRIEAVRIPSIAVATNAL